jgi:hypothetical protein
MNNNFEGINHALLHANYAEICVRKLMINAKNTQVIL